MLDRRLRSLVPPALALLLALAASASPFLVAASAAEGGCARGCVVARSGAPEVASDDRFDGHVLVGRQALRASASGEGLTDLTVHFRGPLGLPSDEDRAVAVARGPSDRLDLDTTFDTATLPPGRYVYYVDAHDGAGRRARSADRRVRIGPSTFRPRVLFDSDYAHVLDVESPYNRDASKTRFDVASLTSEKIRAAFGEIVASGVDTLVLSPGVGEIGYYPTDYYPLKRHREWWRSATGVEPPAEPYVDYALNGGDPIEDARAVVEAAKKKLFVSIRMNDGHAFYLDNALDKTTGKILAGKSPSFYRLYSEFAATHPELRIGPDPTLPTPRYAYLLDYAKGRDGEDPASGLKTSVKAHKLAIVEGMLSRHRVDGVVLDFMRLAFLFNQQQTTSAQRRSIMVDLITHLRTEMDGKHRDAFGKAPQLFVRIPYLPEEWDKLGVSIPEWALAGVDGFVFSFERNWAQPFYYGPGDEKLSRFDVWKSAVGDGVTFLQEINFVTETRNIPDPTGKVDDKTGRPANYTVSRRTREQMIVSGAYAAKSLGADGLYFFNMPYYRGRDSYADPEVSVTPPFALFGCLRDLACFGNTREPYYFLGPKGSLNYRTLPEGSLQLPRRLETGRATFHLYAPRPLDGWPGPLRLRIEVQEPNARIASVSVDGVPVDRIGDVGEPYRSPFRYGQSEPDRTSAYVVDPARLKGGRIEITVEAAPGPRPTVRWIDLTAR